MYANFTKFRFSEIYIHLAGFLINVWHLAKNPGKMYVTPFRKFAKCMWKKMKKSTFWEEKSSKCMLVDTFSSAIFNKYQNVWT